MTETITSDTLMDVVNAFHNVLARELLTVNESGDFIINAGRLRLVMYLRRAWKPNLLNLDSANELWSTIRRDEDNSDFMMELASQVGFYTSPIKEAFNEAILDYLESLFLNAPSDDFDKELMDELFSTGNEEGDVSVMDYHIWVRAAILIRLCSLPHVFASIKSLSAVASMPVPENE